MSTDPHVFVPGEIAIWQNLSESDSYCNGQECMVLSALYWGDNIEDRVTKEDSDAGFGYDVRDAEGEWFAYWYELKKKKPPEVPRVERALDEVTA